MKAPELINGKASCMIDNGATVNLIKKYKVNGKTPYYKIKLDLAGINDQTVETKGLVY